MPDPIRKHVIALLESHEAHATYESATKAVPFKRQGEQPAGLPYSPWQLVEHLRIAQRDILDFCRDRDYAEKSWPDDYWPDPAPADAKAWAQSVKSFLADRTSLRAIARDTPDLLAKVPHATKPNQTYLRQLLLVADHNAYHVGQLIVVRRVMGLWKD